MAESEIQILSFFSPSQCPGAAHEIQPSPGDLSMPVGVEYACPSCAVIRQQGRKQVKTDHNCVVASSHQGTDLCSRAQSRVGSLVSAQPSASAIWPDILFSSFLMYLGQFWSFAPSNESSCWPWLYFSCHLALCVSVQRWGVG